MSGLVPAKSQLLLVIRLLEERQGAPAGETSTGNQHNVAESDRGDIGIAEGRRVHRSERAFVRKSGNRGDKRIHEAHAISTACPRFLQAFDCLTQSPTKTHREYKVLTAAVSSEVGNAARGCRG